MCMCNVNLEEEKKNNNNSNIVRMSIDNGAKISVFGVKQAALPGLLDRLQLWKAKIYPYNLQPISVKWTALCSVTYKNRTVPIEFFVLPGSCQPVIDSFRAVQIKIITMDKNDISFNPVKKRQGSFWWV